MVTTFQCNICGEYSDTPFSELDRESPQCSTCGSTVRLRSIIYILSNLIYGKNYTLPSFPINKKIKGIGMSDWLGYSHILEKKFDYTNTYYHMDPHLDIKSINPASVGLYDFIISSDVFEHIESPISPAFHNLYRLLKPGGSVIFTVPYNLSKGDTAEYFPELHNYSIEKDDKDTYCLKNITKNGNEQIFKDLVFHGGDGFTLEMRLFNKNSLIKEFESAGFKNLEIHQKACREFGICWKSELSLPITAQKPIHLKDYFRNLIKYHHL